MLHTSVIHQDDDEDDDDDALLVNSQLNWNGGGCCVSLMQLGLSWEASILSSIVWKWYKACEAY